MSSFRRLPVAVCLTASLATPLSAAQPDQRVRISLDQTVTTRTAKVGDVVRMHTEEDVTIDGRTVPRGAAVRGTVIRAKRAGRIHGEAALAIGDFRILGAGGVPVAVSDGTITALPRPPAPRSFYAAQTDAEGPILTGLAAGYGAAWLASRWSHSEETVARAGLLAGAATIALVKILPRGEDLQLSPGGAIEIGFAPCGPEVPACQPPDQSSSRGTSTSNPGNACPVIGFGSTKETPCRYAASTDSGG